MKMRLHREGGFQTFQTRPYARSAKGYSQSNSEQLLAPRLALTAAFHAAALPAHKEIAATPRLRRAQKNAGAAFAAPAFETLPSDLASLR